MEHLNPVEKGKQGETEIVHLLSIYGIEQIRVPDALWLHPISKKWYYFEIKNKDPFEPPPDWLQGFPETQFKKDIHIDGLGLTCIYVVRGQNHEWMAQYANKLTPTQNPPKSNLRENLVWFKLSDFISFTLFLHNLGLQKRSRNLKEVHLERTKQ